MSLLIRRSAAPPPAMDETDTTHACSLESASDFQHIRSHKRDSENMICKDQDFFILWNALTLGLLKLTGFAVHVSLCVLFAVANCLPETPSGGRRDKSRQETSEAENNTLVAVAAPSEETEEESAAKKLFLLDTIAQVQRQYLQSEGPKVTFGCLLTALLDLMDSEYGFIGECKYEEDGTMYLQTHAITNIAWNATTRDFYDNNKESGLKFYNMNSLFGKVMTTQAPVISNTPREDSRGCGVPEGHPPLNHFLGIPFFRHGGVMNGMVGIANKPGGFSQKDIEFLEPFTVTCGNLIHAYWQRQRNKELIEGLESKVRERTAALETLNRDLEQANRRVVQAAQAQLQHFACMSHEIRTPLNCIVGLSSLMLSQQQDAIELEDNCNNRQLIQSTDGDMGFQKLTPFQEESIRMIVTSGDLLLTVVNDVLDYSKLESGNVDIEIKPTSLQQVLHAVVHSIQMKIQEKESMGSSAKKEGVGSSMSAPSTTAAGVTITTEFDMNLPDMVQIDGRRLQQILYNLLGNAVKFSPNGGNVELKVQIVEVESKEPREVSGQPDDCSDASQISASKEVSQASGSGASGCPFTKQHTSEGAKPRDSGASGCPFTKEHSSESRCPFTKTPQAASVNDGITTTNAEHPRGKMMLRFIVKDYGKGIEKENFDRIFKPFLQANSTTERVYGGTGLGLAITSKLSKNLGGSISVDSEVGKWSEFTVDLPFLEAPIDVQTAGSDLRQTVVMLIDGQNESWQEDNRQLTAILDHYEVAHRQFASVGDMQQAVNSIEAGQVQCICFVPEDLYATNALAEFRQSKPTCASWISFGPKYKSNGKSHHIRSIRQMLPSVLIEMLVRQTGSGRRRCSITGEGNVELPEQQPNPQDEDDSYRQMKVLIAEDNKINQKVLVRMLKRLRVENVKIADNGKIACDMEEAESFDICLMDMQMPHMDGLEACREILARRQRWEEQGKQSTHPAPAIVFVTAQVSSSFVAECEAAGSSDFLAKPFNVHEIEACLRKVWAERHQA